MARRTTTNSIGVVPELPADDGTVVENIIPVEKRGKSVIQLIGLKLCVLGGIQTVIRRVMAFSFFFLMSSVRLNVKHSVVEITINEQLVSIP